MTQKYRIEGNFDFYSALNSAEPPVVQDESTICLITRMPLTEDHVEMECGHKFNYLPLYNSLVQNTKPSMNYTYRAGQISCPFCRHNQTTLLPFNPKFKKVIGVNLYPFKIGKDSGEMTVNSGNVCKLSHLSECTSPNYTYKFGDNHYCESHHILGSSIEKQQASYSNFLLKKQKSANAKALKAEKEIKKKAATTINKKEKAVKNQVMQEVIDPSTISNNACKAILKTGPRKGQLCLCTKTVNNYCSRHTSKV